MTGTNLLRLLQQTASSAPMMQRTSCRLSGKSLTGQRPGLKSRREGVASSRQALLMVTASVSAAGMLVAIVLPALQLQKLRAVLGTGKKTRLQHQPGSCCKPSLLMRCMQGQEHVAGSAGAACPAAGAAARAGGRPAGGEGKH